MKKLTAKELRHIVCEALGDYSKKEKVRENVQALVISAIEDGTITNDADLQDYYKTLDMSIRALKMIPYDILVQASKTNWRM